MTREIRKVNIDTLCIRDLRKPVAVIRNAIIKMVMG